MIPIFVFSLGMYGQEVINKDGLPCANLAQKIIADSATIWSYPNEIDIDYFCLGEYFALRDSAAGAHIIQTYGDTRSQDPCVFCRHKEHGIEFFYYSSIITEAETSFIAGYNSISTRVIRELLGDKTYQWINETDSNALSAAQIMYELSVGTHSFFSGDLVNDTILNVKLNLEDLPCLKRIDKSLLAFEIFDRGSQDGHVIRYETFKNDGIQVPYRSSGRTWVTMRIDVSNIPRVCDCPALKKHTIWSFPVEVTQ